MVFGWLVGKDCPRLLAGAPGCPQGGGAILKGILGYPVDSCLGTAVSQEVEGFGRGSHGLGYSFEKVPGITTVAEIEDNGGVCPDETGDRVRRDVNETADELLSGGFFTGNGDGECCFLIHVCTILVFK